MRASPFVLALLTALLTLSAYYIPYAWPLVFVALVPLLYAVHQAKSRTHAFWLGTLAGVCIVGGTAAWMFQVRPLPFLESALILNYAALIFSWCVITFSMAPLMGVWAVMVRGLRADRILDIGAAAVLFVACEYLRLFSFNLATYTPGIENPPFFSIGFIGYPLADSLAWLQLSSLAGVYTLSFAVALVNAAFWYALHERQTVRPLYIGGIALTLVVISVLPIVELRKVQADGEMEEAHIGIMSIQEPEDPVRRSDPQVYQDLVADSIRQTEEAGASVILLPEGARFFSRNAWEPARDSEAVVIDSQVRAGIRENVLGSFAQPLTMGSSTPLREKAILTPQGEYLISVFTAIIEPAGFTEEVAEAKRQLGLTNGSYEGLLTRGSIRGTVLFCVEIFTPGLGKKYVREDGANVIFAALSYARFYKSYMLERDTLRLLKVQAVEAGVPVVSSAYYTHGYAIDRFGRVTDVVGAQGQTQAKTVSIEVPIF